MATRNDITGDTIRSRSSNNKAYAEGYERLEQNNIGRRTARSLIDAIERTGEPESFDHYKDIATRHSHLWPESMVRGFMDVVKEHFAEKGE